MARILNIAGQKFGKLTAIRYSHSLNKKAYWICSCECGKEITAPTAYLRCGDTKSCGCLLAPGKSVIGVAVKTLREHRIWRGMVNRCYRKKNADYSRYGGRGITICEEWKASFLKFYEDMGRCPDGFSIDREDNDGPYSKENCRWASSSEQQRNTKRNTMVTIEGETKCLVAWREHFGISKSTYQNRVKSGWDRVRALITPVQSKAPEGWVVVEVVALPEATGPDSLEVRPGVRGPGWEGSAVEVCKPA